MDIRTVSGATPSNGSGAVTPASASTLYPGGIPKFVVTLTYENTNGSTKKLIHNSAQYFYKEEDAKAHATRLANQYSLPTNGYAYKVLVGELTELVEVAQVPVTARSI